MTQHLIRQLGGALITLFFAAVVLFAMVRMVPGDPVVAAIGADNYTAEMYAAMERRLGLDRPWPVQLGDFLGGILRLDFGTSFRNQRPVAANLAEHAPHSLALAVISLAIALAIALPLGVVAAIHRGKALDQVAMVVALLALSIPNFLLGVLLILLFSGRLGWLPTFGVGQEGNLLSMLQHAVLPALTLGASAAGLQARIIRASLSETMGQDYVRTARAKGASERSVLYKHALRNAVPPVITLVALDLARLLTGTVVVETVFSRKGLGKLLVDAIYLRDYPQIQGALLLFIAVIVVTNTLADILYAVADPRVRYA